MFVLCILFPAHIFAQNLSEAAGPKKPVSIIVDEVKAGEGLESQLPRVRNALYEAFSQMPMARPLAPVKVDRAKKLVFVSPSSSKADPAQKLKAARVALEAGQQAFVQFDYKNAENYLLGARDAFIVNLPYLETNRELIEVHMLLGRLYLAMKKSSQGQEAQNYDERARSEFQKVVYLDPTKKNLASQYSPEVAQVYQEVRKSIEDKGLLRLQIESNQNVTKIFVNGKYMGTSPIQMNVIPGEYFIRAEKEGFKSWYGPQHFSKSVEKLHIELKSDGFSDQLADLYRVREGAEQNALDIEDLVALSEKSGCRLILLANFEQATGEYRLLGQLFDAQNREFSQVAFASLGPTVENLRDTSFDLAFTLIGFLQEDGLIAGGPTAMNKARPDLTVGSQDRPSSNNQSKQNIKKPLYKQWWFWVGLAAVGAGGYFAVRGLQNSKSGIVIDNSGNF
ncbi:MAG: PEGA domain-containing protein [Bdellovibrionales bacterium]|nr:PEGA domain-containing protein [Bdellovibrionales bacterium]